MGLAVALALVAGAVFAASPEAGGAEQPSEVSVSNLNETGTTHWCSAQAAWTCAQGFTTGSAAGGYTLTSVTASFLDKAGSPGDIVVTLHASASSSGSDGKRPDAVLATLSGSNPDTAGDHTFTCSGAGCSLAADTTYFVRFSSAGTDNSNEYRWKTVLSAFDETPVPADNGWSLADELDYRYGGGAWTAATDLVGYLKVAAEAVQSDPQPTPTPTPTPTSPPGDVDAGSLSLTMYGDAITAVWDHVAGAESYHVTLKAQGAPGSPVDVNAAYPAFDGDGNAINRKTGDDTKMSLVIADAAAAAGHESGTYWFGLRAANSVGSSAWKAKAVSPSTLVAPDAPANLAAAAGNASVILSWDDPDDDSITGYEYNVNHNATGTGNFTGWSAWQSIASSDADTTSHTITGLAEGREYRYHLRAVNAAGEGSVAPDAHPWFVSATPLSPGPGLEVGSPTSTTAELTLENYPPSWYYKRTSNTGSGQAEGPTPQSEGPTPQSANLSQQSANCEGPISSEKTVAEGLPPGQQSNFQAYNNPECSAEGAIGAQAGTFTLQQSPPQSGQPPDPPPRVWIVRNDCDKPWKVRWERSSGINGYTVDASWNWGKSWSRRFTNKNFNTLFIHDWSRHSTFRFRVRAENEHGHSDWVYSLYTPPQACKPDSVWARWTGQQGHIEVTWPAGHRAAGYDINYSTDGKWSWTRAATYHNTNSFTLTGADPSKDYIFAVRSTKWRSTSSWTLSSPTADLAAENVTVNTATLSLDNHSGGWWVNQTAPSTGTCAPGEADFSHAVGGLSPGATHTFKAYSDSACSNEMADVSFTTLAYGARRSTQDFDTLNGAGNNLPRGIWSNGTTMWVANDEAGDHKLYAYTLATKARDASKDITLHADNADPAGTWSNGTTIWVADHADNKLYAYTLSTGNRDTAKEIDLYSGNQDPVGIWSNGTTMWVADDQDDELYLYNLADGAYRTGDDVALGSGNDNPAGIWSDGTVIWVADTNDFKLYAYNLKTGSRVAAKDFTSANPTALEAAGNTHPYGIWSDRATMWVTDHIDDKIYAYHHPYPDAYPAPAAPASLRAERTSNGLDIAWTHCDTTKPQCSGGSPVTGYTVDLSSDNGTTWVTAKSLSSYTSHTNVPVTWGVSNSALKVRVTVNSTTTGTTSTQIDVAGIGQYLGMLQRDTPGHTVSHPQSAMSNITTDREWTNAFTTGPNPGGYTLNSVTVPLGLNAGSGDLTVAIHALSGNADYSRKVGSTSAPVSTASATLTGTDPSTSSVEYVTYDCSGSGCDLDPNTTYFVYMKTTGGTYQWSYAVGDRLSYPTDNGWDIQAGHYRTRSGSQWGSWGTYGDNHEVRFDFTARPPSPITLAARDVAGTTVTLANDNYPAEWWYQADTGPDTGCKGPVAAGTTELTGLSANTSYTYKSYAKAGCNSADLLGTVAFTTPHTLTVSNLLDTSLTLTLAGHSGNWWYKANKAPHGSCSSNPVTGASVNLSGLTKHTSYTYTAYSASGCADANAIISVTVFTSGDSLEATAITPTGATLTLSGHNAAWYLLQSAPAGPACKTKTAGANTETLTTLVPGTAYTFRAFGDSTNCGTNTNPIAEESFTTPGNSVSNLSATDSIGCWVGRISLNQTQCATSFTTGDSANGYTLHSVTTRFLGGNAMPTGFSVSLRKESGGKPASTALATMTSDAPPSLSGNSTRTYKCSGAGCKLEANTTYFVALTTTETANNNAIQWRMTQQTTEVPIPSDNGWSISNEHRTGSDWSGSVAAPGHLKIAASINPSLTVSSIAQTTATLRLDDHYGAWWYKYTSPSGGSCASVSAGTATADVSNLTKSTKYTFKAYASSANCSGDSSAIDSVVFTTLPTLTASKITDTTATITIAGHTAQWWYKADTGPDSTCQGPVAANTAHKDLTGLTANTTYTYSAFSATNCPNANKIVTGESFKTSNTTVSNLGETASNSNCILGNTTFNNYQRCGAGFTTGSSTNGYTLNSFTVKLATPVGTPPAFTVTLHAVSGNTPSVAAIPRAIFSTSSPSSAGDYTFGCAGSGCQLSANTTYFVVLTVSSTPAQGNYHLWRTTTSTNQTSSPSGWSIADVHRSGSLTSWGTTIQAASMFKVSATTR